MGFKFELKFEDGDDASSFETAVPNWQAGDTVMASGNVREAPGDGADARA